MPLLFKDNKKDAVIDKIYGHSVNHKWYNLNNDYLCIL